MRTIAHIINPVIVEEKSDLFVAQPITFKTMKVAQEFAQGHVNVELYSAQYPEDRPLVPAGFEMTPDIERSILDFGTFQIKRKLPLIKDILDRLYEATKAEFLVYTNVDIALMPHFYLVVDKLIDLGYDAFTINRRTISTAYTQPEDIPLMSAQIGKAHPGHDCFVFKRNAYPNYWLGTTCVGPPKFDWVLALNLFCQATKYKRFENLHLTYHIGEERPGKSPDQADYHLHIENEIKKVVRHYDAMRPPLYDPYIRHLFGRYSPHPLEEKVYNIKDRLYPVKSRLARLISIFR